MPPTGVADRWRKNFFGRLRLPGPILRWTTLANVGISNLYPVINQILQFWIFQVDVYFRPFSKETMFCCQNLSHPIIINNFHSSVNFDFLQVDISSYQKTQRMFCLYSSIPPLTTTFVRQFRFSSSGYLNLFFFQVFFPLKKRGKACFFQTSSIPKCIIITGQFYKYWCWY